MSQTDFNVLSPEGPSSPQELFNAETAEYIDLSSPTPQDSTTKIESTNVTQSLGLQQASYTPSLQPQQGSRVGQKRLWGEMTGDVDAQVAHNASISTSMQWGGSGPRMQRLRPSVSPLQQQQQQRWRQPQQQPQQPSQQSLQHQLLQAQEPRSSAHQLCALSGWPRSKQPLGPARSGLPVVVLNDDSPSVGEARTAGAAAAAAVAAARGATGGLDRQNRRGLNAVASMDNRAASIAVNPNICHMAMPAAGRPRIGRRAPNTSQLSAGTAAVAAASARSSAGRSVSGSSGSMDATSCSSVDTANDAEIARKAQQEEEDAALAHRLMQEEQLMLTQQEAADRHRLRLEMMQQQDQAAQTAALQARGRRGARHPHRLTEEQQQRQQWGAAAMAEALLNMPTPWGRSGGGASRGLPRAFTAVREALLGMQRAGLPPQLLFSDRDFTADDYELLCRLDDTVENRKGAKSATIESMPTQAVPAGGLIGANGEKLSCTVCLEEFAEGTELRSLPCLHKFHKECIDKWLAVKASCPICNRECQ